MSARKYTSEVKNYIFSSFSEESKNTEKYSFQAIHIDGISSKVLAKEHQSALSQGFSIGEEIKKQRGHAQYEMDQYTLKISQEVDKKIQEMKSDVEKSSYEEGMKLAKSEIEKQFRNNFEQQVSDLTNFVNFVKQQQHEVLMNNRKDVLKIIQLVLHWILQKEVKVDYVDKILPMILNHVQENQKIMIKVDPVTFDNFRNANTLLSEKFSSFKDIKVVVDDHISHPGVIVETDSNLYDATYTAQLQLVDELFSSLMESKSGSNITES